jgi:AcrR family transcriptional regulator
MSSKRVETRERILAAARELIEAGHYTVGLGEIGRRAGVSRQAVYLHFASRADLLTALTSWIEEEADLRGLLATVNSAPSGVDALARLLDASARFEPQIHRMVQATLRMQDDPTVATLNRERMRYRFAGMRQVVARIESDGRLAPGWDVDTATAFVWTLTAPSSFDLLVHGHGWSPPQWADSTYRLLCDAFVQAAPDPQPSDHSAT